MKPLTPGELEVMQVLWEHEWLKPAEIQSYFPRPITNMTLRSALKVLFDKGHLDRRKIGKAFFYKAKTPREKALKGLSRRMAEVFAGGSPLALIAQLIKAEELSPQDVEKLQRIATETYPHNRERNTK